MAEQHTATVALAGLSQIPDRVAAIIIPNEPFDPHGDWTQTYTVLASDGGAAYGRVTLKRKRSGDAGAEISVDWRKGLGGPNHWRLAGSLNVAADALGSVQSWQSEGGRIAGFYDEPGDASPN